MLELPFEGLLVIVLPEPFPLLLGELFAVVRVGLVVVVSHGYEDDEAEVVTTPLSITYEVGEIYEFER